MGIRAKPNILFWNILQKKPGRRLEYPPCY